MLHKQRKLQRQLFVRTINLKHSTRRPLGSANNPRIQMRKTTLENVQNERLVQNKNCRSLLTFNLMKQVVINRNQTRLTMNIQVDTNSKRSSQYFNSNTVKLIRQRQTDSSSSEFEVWTLWVIHDEEPLIKDGWSTIEFCKMLLHIFACDALACQEYCFY